MLTPQEVADHAFVKVTFGGYNMTAVDEFLDELTDDYTALYKENAALKAKMKVLVDKVEEYRATEDSMRKALLTAQNMASTMVSEAEERKETLLADAEMEARAKIGALHDEIVAEQKKLNAMKTATREFSDRIRTVCEAHLKILGQLPDLTPEEIAKTSGEAKAERDVTADIEALGQKIVASYRYSDGEAEKNDDDVKLAPEGEKKAEEKTMLFPALKLSEPKKEAREDSFGSSGASDPFADTSTRPIKLADLKFGRNYRADDDK